MLQFYEGIAGLLAMIDAVNVFLFSPISQLLESYLPHLGALNRFIDLVQVVFPGFLSISFSEIILGGGIVFLLVWRVCMFFIDLVS